MKMLLNIIFNNNIKIKYNIKMEPNILTNYPLDILELDITNDSANDTTSDNYNEIEPLALDFLIFNKLTKLNCRNNKIKSLDFLPNTLTQLLCVYNLITSLDNLPLNLIELDCSLNNITKLDNLPKTLKKLTCNDNSIVFLDNLPNGLNSSPTEC